MSRPRVVIAMPSYGGVNGGAKQAQLIPSCKEMPEEDRLDIEEALEISSSLLPYAFNDLWVAALDARDEGRATHFAMLHADIVPQRYWLTRLWQVMRQRQAHLVAAVSPMKDQPPGGTSTAIGDRADWWTTRRHIRLEERRYLPETFCTADVCEPDEVLLVNTGCMLLDLCQPWWDDCDGEGNPFCFDFACRIRKTAEGRRHWCQPEDWRMSRILDRNNARYFATWAVKLRHWGMAYWSNYEDAGLPQPIQTDALGSRELASLAAPGRGDDAFLPRPTTSLAIPG